MEHHLLASAILLFIFLLAFALLFIILVIELIVFILFFFDLIFVAELRQVGDTSQELQELIEFADIQ